MWQSYRQRPDWGDACRGAWRRALRRTADHGEVHDAIGRARISEKGNDGIDVPAREWVEVVVAGVRMRLDLRWDVAALLDIRREELASDTSGHRPDLVLRRIRGDAFDVAQVVRAHVHEGV